MQKRKVAVIFQGIGYNIDKPLLYYSKKIASEHGYDVIVVEFNGIDKGSLKDKDTILSAFDLAVSLAEEQLKEEDFSSCEDIIFVSKSIGTVAASVYAAKHDIPAGQVYYTPFPQTLSHAKEGNGIVFFGDKDPWVEPDTIRDLCISKNIRYRIIEGGNHSLETGHVSVDVENMNNTIREVEDYFDKNHFRE